MKNKKEIAQRINTLKQSGFSINEINEILDFQEILDFNFDLDKEEFTKIDF
jgi:DNA-binding transcriptional MerR regulator